MIRYIRQTALSKVGVSGQRKLLDSKVLVVGVGGLGCPAAQSLVASGVGNITLIDSDRVTLSNLHRQILFSDQDLGLPKAQVACRVLSKLNSDVNIRFLNERLDLHNVDELFDSHDLIVDGSDNFETKLLINDAALIYNKPWVYGSVSKFESHIALFDSKFGSCYRCLFPGKPTSYIQNCSEQGVLGVLTSMVGSQQAFKAIQYLINSEWAQPGRVKINDYENDFSEVFLLNKRKDCICSDVSTVRLQSSHSNVICELTDSFQKTWADYYRCDGTKILIDVRSSKEFQEYHHPDALLANLESVIPNADYVFLYCQSGVRSLNQCERFRKLGYNAFSIFGGLESL